MIRKAAATAPGQPHAARRGRAAGEGKWMARRISGEGRPARHPGWRPGKGPGWWRRRQRRRARGQEPGWLGQCGRLWQPSLRQEMADDADARFAMNRRRLILPIMRAVCLDQAARGADRHHQPARGGAALGLSKTMRRGCRALAEQQQREQAQQKGTQPGDHSLCLEQLAPRRKRPPERLKRQGSGSPSFFRRLHRARGGPRLRSAPYPARSPPRPRNAPAPCQAARRTGRSGSSPPRAGGTGCAPARKR